MALLVAGLEGVRKELMPPVSVGSDIYDMTSDERQEREIDGPPSSLVEAVQEPKRDLLLREVLDSHVYQKYIKAKEQGWGHSNSTVT